MGMICAVIANSAVKKKGGGHWKPQDFMPKRRRVKAPRTDLPDWIKEKLDA